MTNFLKLYDDSVKECGTVFRDETILLKQLSFAVSDYLFNLKTCFDLILLLKDAFNISLKKAICVTDLW